MSIKGLAVLEAVTGTLLSCKTYISGLGIHSGMGGNMYRTTCFSPLLGKKPGWLDHM